MHGAAAPPHTRAHAHANGAWHGASGHNFAATMPQLPASHQMSRSGSGHTHGRGSSWRESPGSSHASRAAHAWHGGEGQEKEYAFSASMPRLTAAGPEGHHAYNGVAYHTHHAHHGHHAYHDAHNTHNHTQVFRVTGSPERDALSVQELLELKRTTLQKHVDRITSFKRAKSNRDKEEVARFP